MDTLKRVGKHQDTDSHTRTWSAHVVMVVATVMRLTGIKLNDDDSIQIMLSYLYLGKDVCEYVVNQMDESVRLVLSCVLKLMSTMYSNCIHSKHGIAFGSVTLAQNF